MPDSKKFNKNCPFLFFLLLIFFISSLINVNALEIQLSRQAYNSGETLMARLEANFSSSLSPQDVFFYRGHVLVNMVYDAVLAGNVFYIYAVPDTARNYTLVIKNVKYRENGIAKEADVSKNFTVLEEKAEFSVNPGFILASEGSEFNIRLANKKDNFTEIKAGFQGAQQTIILPPLDSRTAVFTSNNIDEFAELSLSLQGEKTSYSLPVLAYPSQEAAQNQSQQGNASNVSSYTAQTNVSLNSTNQSSSGVANTSNASVEENTYEIPQQESLRFNPGSINDLSLIREQLPFKFIISLMSLHTGAIEDISFSYSSELEGIISISPDFIGSIEPASSQDIEITINEADEGFFNGTIKAESISGNFSAIFYFEVNITEDFSSIPEDIPAAECNEEGETICQASEYCDGGDKSYLASGGICCFGGTCKEAEQEKPKSSSSGKIIGFIILFALIIIALLLFMKFKKAPKKEITDVYKKAEEGVKRGI
ncbi:MAG TPA: hypothetical protein VJA86_03885 [Candidatus Nanoarchaeia archaeon]|nr:hypothetical protein [Candidatus Nanoarchaeia archaeon]